MNKQGHSKVSITASVVYIGAVAAFCTELARNMGFNEEEVYGIQLAGEEGLSNVDIETRRNQTFNLAEIVIHRYGADVLDAVQNQVRSLREEKVDVIHAVLNIEDPFTPKAVSELESSGFYFAGILPYGIDNQHCLIMQFLNDVKIDFERINLISTEASGILDFIKGQDGRRDGEKV